MVCEGAATACCQQGATATNVGRKERRASLVIAQTAQLLDGLHADAERGDVLLAELETLLASLQTEPCAAPVVPASNSVQALPTTHHEGVQPLQDAPWTDEADNAHVGDDKVPTEVLPPQPLVPSERLRRRSTIVMFDSRLFDGVGPAGSGVQPPLRVAAGSSPGAAFAPPLRGQTFGRGGGGLYPQGSRPSLDERPGTRPSIQRSSTEDLAHQSQQATPPDWAAVEPGAAAGGRQGASNNGGLFMSGGRPPCINTRPPSSQQQQQQHLQHLSPQAPTCVSVGALSGRDSWTDGLQSQGSLTDCGEEELAPGEGSAAGYRGASLAAQAEPRAAGKGPYRRLSRGPRSERFMSTLSGLFYSNTDFREPHRDSDCDSPRATRDSFEGLPMNSTWPPGAQPHGAAGGSAAPGPGTVPGSSAPGGTLPGSALRQSPAQREGSPQKAHRMARRDSQLRGLAWIAPSLSARAASLPAEAARGLPVGSSSGSHSSGQVALPAGLAAALAPSRPLAPIRSLSAALPDDDEVAASDGSPCESRLRTPQLESADGRGRLGGRRSVGLRRGGCGQVSTLPQIKGLPVESRSWLGQAL